MLKPVPGYWKNNFIKSNPKKDSVIIKEIKMKQVNKITDTRYFVNDFPKNAKAKLLEL